VFMLGKKLRVLVGLAIIFLVFSRPVAGQVAVEIFYNAAWQIVPKPLLHFKRNVQIDTADATFMGPVKDFYKDGALAMTGGFLKGKQHGPFVLYYPNGKVEREGMYQNGRRKGNWKFFWPNGQLRHEIVFLGKKDSVIQSLDLEGKVLVKKGTGAFFFDAEHYDRLSNARFEVKGTLLHGKREGIWTMAKDSSGAGVEEKFVNGKFVKGRFLSSNEVYKDESLIVLPEINRFEITGKYSFSPSFNNVQEAIKYILEPATRRMVDSLVLAPKKEEFPEFPGGKDAFLAYISSKMSYPKSLLRTYPAPTGTVVVTFVISEEGDAQQITLLKGVNEVLNAQAISIIKGMPRWKPGKLNGKNVAVKFTVPFRYLPHY
jgi:hypothetical protein